MGRGRGNELRGMGTETSDDGGGEAAKTNTAVEEMKGLTKGDADC